jgi:hypothetical protein
LIHQQEIVMSKTIKETPSDTRSTKQDEILSRRAVLRGALIMSCSMLVPISLLSSPANAATDAPAGAKKLDKLGVKYQEYPKYKEKGSNKDEEKCGICANFLADSKTCKRVEGPVKPEGWCLMWAKKA